MYCVAEINSGIAMKAFAIHQAAKSSSKISPDQPRLSCFTGIGFFLNPKWYSGGNLIACSHPIFRLEWRRAAKADSSLFWLRLQLQLAAAIRLGLLCMRVSPCYGISELFSGAVPEGKTIQSTGCRQRCLVSFCRTRANWRRFCPSWDC